MKKREKTYSGTRNPEVSRRELQNRAVARRAAAEGMVLMKNEGVLPLRAGSRIGLFGAGAGCTIKGGTGSGDVNERDRVSIYQGLLRAGFAVTSEDWLGDYEQRYQQSREEWKNKILEEAGQRDALGFFQVYASHAYRMPEGRPIKETDLEGADTAVYVISRIAGEDADRFADEGDYYLSQAERRDLEAVCRYCGNVVVLLNAGGQVDLSVIQGFPQVKGLLFIGQPGMEGGNAVADVLGGAVTPCGKLTDTWAKRYEDFPNAAAFSHQNKNADSERYEEGIFVGYRYFDTFQVEPEYPFGFGLSYTRFEIGAGQPRETDAGRIEIEVSVKNAGAEYAGREVVQVYAAMPQSGLPKEYKRLCAFAKTGLLAPGASETLTLSFPLKALACYDERKNAWIVEKGLYGILAGDSSRSGMLAGVLEAKEELVLERTDSICPLREELSELTPVPALCRGMEGGWLNAARLQGLEPVQITLPDDPAKACGGGKVRISERQEALIREAERIAAALTDEELVSLSVGEVGRSHNNALGSAGVMVPGSAGETSGILEEKWDVPGVPMADGPAGLRLIRQYEVDRENGAIYGYGFLEAMEGGMFAPKKERRENTDIYYQYCTAFPVGALLAQTWDTQLLEEVGRAVALEMRELGVAWWLAPGMNIHRNPLCGRNFEYYSEDPVVSGRMAAAITRGVQSLAGVGTTIKHFACNNQEDNRMGSDSIVSERALREIYLRGFEIAVKTAQPMAIMTSYNLVNGVHSANNRDLCTTAARKEWDFQGLIMTDWTTTSDMGGSLAWKCIQAGNDLIMPGTEEDKENIREALRSGKLSREELRACAARMLRVIFQTLVYEDCGVYGEQFIVS